MSKRESKNPIGVRRLLGLFAVAGGGILGMQLIRWLGKTPKKPEGGFKITQFTKPFPVRPVPDDNLDAEI